MRAYDKVCFQTQASRNAWALVPGARLENSAVVPNGVEVERFMSAGRRERVRSDEPFRLISIGRLHPMKGHRHLVEAMRLLQDPKVTLDIYGVGEEEKTLKRQVDRHGLGQQVRFHGHVENPEAKLADADCFVLASVSHESCPLVIPEAMAAGVPLITSDYGPLPELNVDELTGLVATAGDPGALAAAIRRLMADPELCTRMGNAGRIRAQQMYSHERMIRSMLRLYNEAAGKGKGD
jgi:glycosyltransferase involved in cell wall biosynthesis